MPGFRQRLPDVRSGLLSLLVIASLLLVACGPAAVEAPQSAPSELESSAGEATAPAPESPAEQPGESYPAQESYPPPPPNIPLIEESYPVATMPPPTETPSVYPPPTVEEVFAEPRFRLDLPIAAGDSEVTGQALPGMALAIVDVTYNGAVLGLGRADADGRFRIEVDGLEEGNRLGLTFGELEAGLDISEMTRKYFPHRGEGYMSLPNVGVMLDTTLIAPEP